MLSKLQANEEKLFRLTTRFISGRISSLQYLHSVIGVTICINIKWSCAMCNTASLKNHFNEMISKLQANEGKLFRLTTRFISGRISSLQYLHMQCNNRLILCVLNEVVQCAKLHQSFQSNAF